MNKHTCERHLFAYMYLLNIDRTPWSAKQRKGAPPTTYPGGESFAVVQRKTREPWERKSVALRKSARVQLGAPWRECTVVQMRSAVFLAEFSVTATHRCWHTGKENSWHLLGAGARAGAAAGSDNLSTSPRLCLSLGWLTGTLSYPTPPSKISKAFLFLSHRRFLLSHHIYYTAGNIYLP